MYNVHGCSSLVGVVRRGCPVSLDESGEKEPYVGIYDKAAFSGIFIAQMCMICSYEENEGTHVGSLNAVGIDIDA